MKGAIKIFDLESKALVHHIPQAHAGAAIAAVVTNDGDFLISTGEEKSLRFFPLQAKKVIREIMNNKTPFEDMVVTPDQKYVITAWLSPGDIKIHEISTNKEVHVFQRAHTWRISSIAVSPDRRLLVSGDATGQMKVWDLVNFKQIYDKEQFHSTFIEKVVVTMDSKYFITSCRDTTIKITDIATFQTVYEFNKGIVPDKEHEIALTPDGKFLLASKKGTIKMFDLTTKELVYQFTDVHQGFFHGILRFYKGFVDDIVAITVTPNNRYMISGSRDESVKLFDLQTKQFVHHFTKEHEYDASSIGVTKNSRYFIIGCGSNEIRVFDIERRELVQIYKKTCERGVACFGVVHDGKILITASHDNKVKSFDFELEKFKLNNKGEHSDLEYLEQEIFFQYNGMRSYSIFNSVDDFLFEPKTPLPILIASALNCQELSVQPFAWNILHIVALQGNHAFIKELPEIGNQFKVPFLLDRFGKTPLHYLIANRRVDYTSINCMFSYICDYLDQCYKSSIYEFQNIMKSLTMLIPFILNKLEPRLKERFLTLSLATSPVPFNQEPPPFGSANSTSCFYDLPVLDEKSKSQIWRDGETAVSCQTNFLQLDYNAHSQDMKVMVDLMIKQKSEDFFKTPLISKLIDHLWSQTLPALFMSFLAFSIYMSGLSVYICLSEGKLVYEVVLLALSGFFILSEVLQMYDLGKDYLKNFWNLLDITHLFLTVAFLITRIAKSEDDLARAWIATIVILLGYLRWVSFLRIFQQTRNLIQVIITIAKDMLSFVVIIAMIIFGFSIIFLVFERENEYGIYLYNTYSILYGPLDIEDDVKYSVSLKIIMVVIAFLLNVLLLNLLISIMGDSYDKILEKRDKTDALTRLEMMSEAMTYMKVFKWNTKLKRGYLLYCISMDVDEEEGGQDEWEGRINVMKKLLKQSNEQNKELKELTDKRIQELNQKMDSCYQKLEQRLEQKIKESNDKLEKNIANMIQGLFQQGKTDTATVGMSSQNKIQAIQQFLQ